jgi:predicted Zn finger-like uncharacterized protein
MLIVCPSCATSYDVELASLGPLGRQVRCSRCRTVWRAVPAHADKLLAAAEAIAPAAVAEPVLEDAHAPRLHEPAVEAPTEAVEAPTEEASELRRRIAAMDEPEGEEEAAEGEAIDAPAAEGEAADAPAAEHEDPPTAEDAGLSDEPIEAAEVESPPIVPVDLDEGRPPIDIDAADFAERSIGPGADVESVAARRFRLDLGSRPRWPLSHLQTFILALVIVDAIVVGWRNDFVRLFPQTSAFYALTGLSVNLRGVDFAGVTTIAEQHEGVPILVVQGNIANTARKVVDVPRIKFIARNAARQEIYSWTAAPARTVLSPGEVIPFRSRLASPPTDAQDVLVRFVNRRDVLAGTR